MNVDEIQAEALTAVLASSDERSLDDVRVRFLGKKGALTALLKGLGKMDASERPAAGARINAAKAEVQTAIEARKTTLTSEQLSKSLDEEAVDVTLPGRRTHRGGLHPHPN